MIPLQHMFHWISLRQYEFQMAWGVFGQAFTLLTFETFAMVFCDKFGITGYPALFMYAILPVMGVIGVTYSGHKMVTTGYAKQFQKNAANINQDWIDLLADVKKIREKIETE